MRPLWIAAFHLVPSCACLLYLECVADARGAPLTDAVRDAGIISLGKYLECVNHTVTYDTQRCIG